MLPQIVWKKKGLCLSLLAMVGLTGAGIGTIAIAPTPVHAYVARADITLDVQSGENFSTFLSRAETVARAAIQRTFDRDILISEAYVVIVGQRQGQSAPVLQVQVSRNQWRSRPDPRRWATYFSSTKILLGFDTPAPKAATPASAATPTPTPITTPATSVPTVPPPSSQPARSPNPPLPPPPMTPPSSTKTNPQTPASTPLPPSRTR